MDDSSSNRQIVDFDGPIKELVQILLNIDVDPGNIERYLDKYQGIEYIGDIQSVLDAQELLRMGLIK